MGKHTKLTPALRSIALGNPDYISELYWLSTTAEQRYYQLSYLQQHMFIVSQFLWVRSLDMD